jgi:hypothetical protein
MMNRSAPYFAMVVTFWTSDPHFTPMMFSDAVTTIATAAR